jgi:hypothetical protein
VDLNPTRQRGNVLDGASEPKVVSVRQSGLELPCTSKSVQEIEREVSDGQR